MLQSKHRRASWRRIKSEPSISHQLRKVCYSILLLELAFFWRESGSPFLPFLHRQEEVRLEQRTGEENHREGYEKIYGFQFRLKDGVLDIYRKEEFRSTQ